MNQKPDVPGDVPEGLFGLITGGRKFLRTLKLYYFEGAELGQRCKDLDFKDISNPWSFGGRCAALIAIAAWILNERSPGGIKDILKPFFTEPTSLFHILGFLILLQIIFRRSLSVKLFAATLSVVVYALSAFILPFIAIVASAQLFRIWPDSIPLAIVFVIAPFAGYTILLVPSRMFGKILECEESSVFGVFLAYGVAATVGVDYIKQYI